MAECVAIAVDEYERIADFAESNEVELVVVGPELIQKLEEQQH